MKTNELMIGDWVHLKDCDGAYDIITGVTKRGVLLDANSDGSFDEIEPIPLTAEILEKNGFKQVGDDIWQLDVKSHWFWVDFNQYIFGCDLNTSTNEQENSFRILCISCNLQVHELQHALRLCGIDKEIVL